MTTKNTKAAHTPIPQGDGGVTMKPRDGYYPGEELERIRGINADLLAAGQEAMRVIGGLGDYKDGKAAKMLRAAILRATGQEGR